MNKTLLSNGVKQIRVFTNLFFALVLAGSLQSVSAQVSLVKDLNTYNESAYAYDFSSLTRHDNHLYVVFQNGLYKSDGTDEGTILIRQFDYASAITSCGSNLFFIANDGESGNELWKTDGTPEGTVIVKDIYSGVNSSAPNYLIDYSGILYFAATDGYAGIELWRSDGTSTGTYLVKDILRVSGSSKPQNPVVMNNLLYFRANNGTHGFELWRTDGTSAGTTLVADINTTAKIGANPEHIVTTGTELFFFANDGVNGKQLWKSNGQIGNAQLVKAIKAGGTTGLDHLTAVNDIVFFQANDGIHGNELWKSDGTFEGTQLVKDLTPGPGSQTGYAIAHLDHFKECNGKLYFIGTDDGHDLYTSDGTTEGTIKLTTYTKVLFPWISHNAGEFNGITYFVGDDYSGSGLALWRTDGTVAGTYRVKESIGEGLDSNPMFTELNGQLYFIGKAELWKTDGTEPGTRIVKFFGNVPGSSPVSLTDVNGTLFFTASDGYSRTLFRTNGTEESTIKLHPYLRNANNLRNISGTVYFAGEVYRYGTEIWKSDGTEPGTIQVKDIESDSYPTGSSYPSEFTELNAQVFFKAKTEESVFLLYRTDGTDEGTTLVEGSPGDPTELTRVGDKIFFAGYNSPNGNELWVTDGTTARMTRDIRINYRPSNPIRLTEFNGMVYFQADNGGNGYELWRSDGTTTGTVIVKDFRTGDLGSGDVLGPVDMGNMKVVNNSLYLTAIRATGKNALWKSDGTGTGTRVVKEFAGQPESDIIGAINNEVIFTLSYGTYTEVWKSNGTSAGTVKVKTFSDLAGLIKPYQVAIDDNVIYFIGLSGTQARIYRTDGTAEGSYTIAFRGNPYQLASSGGLVYLSGQSESFGWELFTIDESASDETMIAARVQTESTDVVLSGNEELISNYPNPFKANFSLRVNGTENGAFRMEVVNINGNSIEEKELLCNTDHSVGDNWSNGIYIVRIYADNKFFTKKIVKSE